MLIVFIYLSPLQHTKRVKSELEMKKLKKIDSWKEEKNN